MLHRRKKKFTELKQHKPIPLYIMIIICIIIIIH